MDLKELVDNLQQFCVDDNSDYNTSNSSCMSSEDEDDCFQKYDPSKKFNKSELEVRSRRFAGYESKTYDKSNWIKATFDNKTKRFPNPPNNIEELHVLLKRRFGVLREVLEMGYTAVITYKPASNLAYRPIQTSTEL